MDREHCEVCGKIATVHTCEIRDGEKTEHHLCAEHGGHSVTTEADVEQFIRQVILLCRMVLREDRRSPDAVAAEIRRLVERALADLRDDAEAFGFEA
jgi:protein-arginine kinase activator protein McsA